MAAPKRPVSSAKKTKGKQVAALRSQGSPKVVSSPVTGNALPEQSAAFDPFLFVEKLTTGKTRLEFKQGKPVFSQGDPADAVFYIQAGKLKLTVVSKQGKEAVIAILPEGSFFGEGCLAGQPFRMASACTVEPSTVIRVEKAAMLHQLHMEPDFAERFLAYVLSRNIRMEADLVDHLFNSSEKRLARLLLLMAHYGRESRPVPLIAKVSQKPLLK